MATTNHELRVINGLIETTIDSVEGYRDAAQDVQNSTFRTMFERRASERQAAVAGLQAYVVLHGGKAEDSGTVLASAHRVFVDLRAALSKGDEAVVKEVERGEDHIKHKYEDALKDVELSPSARDTVDKAFASVRAGHDEMSRLKHGLEGLH
ncbi:PA2169 family four-helix-bundle protein [Lysobacter sp. MMG2]|uniref:PA2169 family four-helix-bundle protein n=1 Tax=Lysobacter sp. MMG2 TaxID=2801338 RepID=UPI001C211C77|nr:PA2169 family four-helix-bundle protein [Lysobacter sp. MMG2]MBU8977644.1 PA2169 family four-helix-bundle protein [Lysobacter sp. MMG2]